MGKNNWVYILKGLDSSNNIRYYIGTTYKLFNRLVQHRNGKCKNTSNWGELCLMGLYKSDVKPKRIKIDRKRKRGEKHKKRYIKLHDLNLENHITRHLMHYEGGDFVRGGQYVRSPDDRERYSKEFVDFKPEIPLCDCGNLSHKSGDCYICMGRFQMLQWDKLVKLCKRNKIQMLESQCNFVKRKEEMKI